MGRTYVVPVSYVGGKNKTGILSRNPERIVEFDIYDLLESALSILR
jgi:hypothetical protein